MRSILVAAVLAGTAAALASAQTSRPPGELLERIAGRWVLEGTIAGKTTTHDVVASFGPFWSPLPRQLCCGHASSQACAPTPEDDRAGSCGRGE